MDDRERVELEADVEKIHSTLESDRSQWQFDYDYDSDEDSEEEDALFIDLDKHGSATVSLASASAHSAGGRTTPSGQSLDSRRTAELQSVTTDQDEDAEQIFREVGVVLDKIDTTPGLPASLESCLIINRAYQDIIMEHLSRIDLALAENREAQKKLEEDAKDNTRQLMTRKRFPYSMTPPYFKGSLGSCPQPNEDVQLKQMAHEPDLDSRPEPKWAGRQRRLLIEAVKEDSLEKLLQPLLSRRELEEEKLQQVPEKSAELKAIQARIAAIDREIDTKKNTSDDRLLQDVDKERVDWMKIANITFGGKRDWMSCKRAWMHYADPKLNQTPFSEDESKHLQQLVAETKGRNWVYIAQQLGTGRTAFQCLQHYQQNLNSEKLQRPWTKEEDERLLRVVERCQQYHFNWNKVSQYMEGRNSFQCYKRFTKLDPKKTTGHWTEEEDAQLIAAVQLFGTSQWAKVQELVPGRTREQCRERYLNSLDPSISGEPWTYGDDREMLNGVAKYGKGQWTKIAREFCSGRTDNQVLQRHRRLEDWRRKTEWFQRQTGNTQKLLQGSNLPADKREEARLRNWDQYRELFNVFPGDYEKQREDRERGLTEVPRPPFLLGLANKKCAKIWERRMRLHELIEEHLEKMRDRLEWMNDDTTTGMYNLQDAIARLSREVITHHKAELTADVLTSRKPSAISVGDMLALTRGNVEQLNKPRVVRGPQRRKKKPKEIKRTKWKAVNKIDKELRLVMRHKLKHRALKKGRPRRFFWDACVEQGMAPEQLDMMRATAMNLYFKSLGADPGSMLAKARKCFPDLAAKVQAESEASKTQDSEEEQEEETAEEGTTVRRSRRSRKPKKDDHMVGMSENAEDLEPCIPEDHIIWRKRRDYELLEWMCRQLEIRAEEAPPEDLSAEVEIRCDSEGDAGSQKEASGLFESDPGAFVDRPKPTGMRQVNETVLQALRNSLAQKQKAGLEKNETAAGSRDESMRRDAPLAEGQQGPRESLSRTGTTVTPSVNERTAAVLSSPLTECEKASSCNSLAQSTNVTPSTSGIVTHSGEVTVSSSDGDIAAGTSGSPTESVQVTPSTSASEATASTSGSEVTASTSGSEVTPSTSAGEVTASTSGSRNQNGGVTPSTSSSVIDLGLVTRAVQVGPSSYRVFPTGKDAPVTQFGTGQNKHPHIHTPKDFTCINDRPKYPNLPPTKTSMQSFKLLLLKRLELIRNAGPYYDSTYYAARKDAQLESLRKAGQVVPAVNRGSMDLARLMNKVCQTATGPGRGKYKRKKPGEAKFSESPEFCAQQVMNSVRQSEAYKTLLSRFEALFLWPAFLSAVYPPFQRHDFTEKAAGAEKRKHVKDAEDASFNMMRYRPPLLKSKRFYKFANKPKQTKEAIRKNRRQKRILKIVQDLMADEDDPRPEVSLFADSDDEGEASGSGSNDVAASNHSNISANDDDDDNPQPGTSTTGDAEATASEEPPPRKRPRQYRKRPKDLAPSRQSARNANRVHYSERINAKRDVQRRPVTKREPPDVPVMRHVNKHLRRRMIDAMVHMKENRERKGTDLADGGSGVGGYVSDDDMQVEETGDEWLGELTEEQKVSLLQLEMDVVADNPGTLAGTQPRQQTLGKH